MAPTAATLASHDDPWRRALARSARVSGPSGAIAGHVWKALREVAAVNEFAAVMREAHGLRLSHIRSHPRQDAPDCLFRFRGREHTAEVTELIDEGFARFISVRARDGEAPRHAPPSLCRGFWDRERFLAKLTERVRAKERVARDNDRRIDTLIITTCEPMLRPAEVEAWLETWAITPISHVKSGFLLMEPDPAFGPLQPLFPLFGDFPPPRPARRFSFVRLVSRLALRHA